MSNPKATSEYISLKSDYEEEYRLRKEAEAELEAVNLSLQSLQEENEKLRDIIDSARDILSPPLEDLSSFLPMRNRAMQVLNGDIDSPEKYS